MHYFRVSGTFYAYFILKIKSALTLRKFPNLLKKDLFAFNVLLPFFSNLNSRSKEFNFRFKNLRIFALNKVYGLLLSFVTTLALKANPISFAGQAGQPAAR